MLPPQGRDLDYRSGPPRAVPSKHGLPFDQEQGVAPAGKDSREQHEQAALVAAKAGAFDTA